MGTLAIITIGQSPRVDLTPEISDFLPQGTVLLECGALDGMTSEEIVSMAPTQGDQVLTTRMRDGSPVILGRRQLIARLQTLILETEKDVDVVMLACTGEFPTFSHTAPLVEPDIEITRSVAVSALGFRTIGIICPLLAQQVTSASKFYASLPKTVRIVTAAATPYTTDIAPLEVAASQLRSMGAEIIVLDCIGYTQSMCETVEKISGLPVLLSRTVAAQAASTHLTSLA